MTRHLPQQHDVVAVQNPLVDSSIYMSKETTTVAVRKSVSNAALRILQGVASGSSSSSNNSDASSSSSINNHHYPFEDNPAANFTTGNNHTNNHNNNNNMMDHISHSSASSTTTNMIVVGILIAIIILLSMVFLGMVIPPLLRYIQRQIPVSQKRIDERYETIEGWLISKRVREHDSACDKLRHEFTSSSTTTTTNVASTTTTTSSPINIPNESTFTTNTPTELLLEQEQHHHDPREIQLASSYDSAETAGTEESDDDGDDEHDDDGNDASGNSSSSNMEQHDDEDEEDVEQQQLQEEEEADAEIDAVEGEDKECPICMEAFTVGDIVSWSPNTKTSCTHVFHHECIKEWLLRSGNCPCCREIILPIDAPDFSVDHNNNRAQLQELSILRSKKAATTYYCQTHGLVTLTGQNNNQDKRKNDGGKDNDDNCKKPQHAAVLKCSRRTYECIKSVTQCSIKSTDLCQFRQSRIHATSSSNTQGAAIDGGGDSSSNSSRTTSSRDDDDDIETGNRSNSLLLLPPSRNNTSQESSSTERAKCVGDSSIQDDNIV